MPSKKHSKLVLIIAVTASFLLCTRYESEANLVISLRYELLENLQNHILIIQAVVAEKNYGGSWYVPEDALSCISTSPNTMVWLGWLQPSCLPSWRHHPTDTGQKCWIPTRSFTSIQQQRAFPSSLLADEKQDVCKHKNKERPDL